MNGRLATNIILIVGNTILASCAWLSSAFLFVKGHPVAGSFMMAMPILFHFSESEILKESNRNG